MGLATLFLLPWGLLVGCAELRQGGTAGSSEAEAEELLSQALGCYALAAGPWSPGPDGGSLVNDDMVPKSVLLTALPVDAKRLPGSRRVMVVSQGGSFIRFGRWTPAPNGQIELLLTNGLSGVTARLGPSANGWEGQAHSFWDFNHKTEEATLRLKRVDSPETRALVAQLTGGARGWPTDAGPATSGAAADARALVQRLLEVGTRDAAACALLKMQRYTRTPPAYTETFHETCHINDVRVAPQRDGSLLYAVFWANDFSRSYTDAGVPKGHVIIFTEEGEIVPFFAAANVIGADDELFDFDGRGHLAFAFRMLYSLGTHDGRGQATAPVLDVVPLTREQKAILSVAYMAPARAFPQRCHPDATPPKPMSCLGDVCFEPVRGSVCDYVYPRAWRIRRDHADNRIEIGTSEGLARDVPDAVFRWNPQAQRYDGPAGGPDAGWMRLEGADAARPFRALERFARDVGIDVTPAGGG